MKKLALALSLTFLICAFSSVTSFAQTDFEAAYPTAVAPRLNHSFDLDVSPQEDMLGGWKTIVNDELWWTDSVTFELDDESDCSAEFRVYAINDKEEIYRFILDPGESVTVEVETFVEYNFQVRHDENSTQRLVGSISD